MTYEEYLKKRLDRLNQNSHYGIMIDTEITKIVRSHIKRLEDNEMKATSVQKIENVKEMHFTIEKACTDEISKVIVGVDTNDDIFEFHFSGVGCDVFADQWFNAIADKPYKMDFESERNKRKMMETENAILREKNHKLRKENEKLNDRIGNLVQEDMKLRKEIKDLEKQLNNDKETLRKAVDYWAGRARALEKSFTLEKAANEAQHRFIREYAGKDTEVEFNHVVNESENEVSYVIVDIDDIWISQEGDKMSLQLKNRDDITKIILTGDAIKNHNEQFVTVLKTDVEENEKTMCERDQEINELHQKLYQVEKDKERLTNRYNALSSNYEKEISKVEKLEKQLNAVQLMLDNFKKDHTDIMKTSREKHNDEVEQLNQLLTLYEKRLDELIKEKKKLIEENKELKYQLGDIQTTKEVVEQKLNTRADILDQAKKCVCGQREQDYGTPESNFQLIADLWNGYLGFTSYVLELEEHLMELKDKGIDVNIDIPKPKAIFPEDVAMMMSLMKIARIKNGGGSGDSFVDLAGYAACGGEIWHEQKVKDQN